MFNIGDYVRLKPRGHKMIISFIYSPQSTGVYLGAYNSMKLQYPRADFFYVCVNPTTGKEIKKIFPEDLIEKVLL